MRKILKGYAIVYSIRKCSHYHQPSSALEAVMPEVQIAWEVKKVEH